MNKEKDYSQTLRAPLTESSVSQPEGRSPRLVVVRGPMLGHQIELGAESILIGRANDCALVLPHASVSRWHCRIVSDQERYFVEDLNSTNHTYVNGAPIARTELRDADQIRVGDNVLKFFVGSSAEAKYHRELINLAICDSLTGFYNRRHFRVLLDDKIEQGPQNTALCLLMLDLDRFKMLNDLHGHLVGDQVLAAVAAVLRERIPCEAIAGRLGGEEFAVIYRTVSLHEAVALGEILRDAVAALHVKLGELELKTSVSIGVAAMEAGDDSSALLRAADKYLYLAKQNGRNRVVSALDQLAPHEHLISELTR